MMLIKLKLKGMMYNKLCKNCDYVYTQCEFPHQNTMFIIILSLQIRAHHSLSAIMTNLCVNIRTNILFGVRSYVIYCFLMF